MDCLDPCPLSRRVPSTARPALRMLLLYAQYLIWATIVNIAMQDDIYYQEYGPWTNAWGYCTTLAIIDDLYITKVYTPYDTREISYFGDESRLNEYIDLINQDRRF
jgi:hypothetical protein